MMVGFYQSAWTKDYGLSATDKKGNLTEDANTWLIGLNGLTDVEILKGLKSLKFRDNVFPPHVLEFFRICSNDGLIQVTTEIKRFINRSKESEFWWTDKLAFNIYSFMNYIPHEGLTNSQIEAKIKNIYSSIDRSSLMPIPKKPVAELLAPEQDKEWNQKKRRFHSALTKAIYKYNPTLFLSGEQIKDLNCDPKAKLPSVMQKLFNSNNAHGLMRKFVEVTGFNTKPPKESLNDENKAEWRNYRVLLDKAMDRFVIDGEILA